MNKKILTIQVLKQRIHNMQQELNKIQTKKIEHQQISKFKSIKKSKEKSQSSFRNTSTNKRYKSPTFWTGNTVLGQQNPYFSNQHIPTTPSPKNREKRNLFTKSPILQKIKNDVDLNYYQSAPMYQKNKQNTICRDKPNDICNKKGFGLLFDLNRDMQKIQKKRTYNIPRKNPILDPGTPKANGKKIPIRPSLSPQNMYIDNPKSNPNLYFHPNSTQPILLSKSPKHSKYFNRNNSPDLKLLLSCSAKNLRSLSPALQSGKKHYGKYYDDNLASKWQVGW